MTKIERNAFLKMRVDEAQREEEAIKKK